jgi:hypothetical protein
MTKKNLGSVPVGRPFVISAPAWYSDNEQQYKVVMKGKVKSTVRSKRGYLFVWNNSRVVYLP